MMKVANPRKEFVVNGSTGHAAALVAGALARQMQREKRSAVDRLLSQAREAAALGTKISKGRVLRVVE